MGDQSIQRRLAAILAADVADYSRLMNEDEAATIEAWHAARALIDPTIAAFGGRIVKHTGDGFLAEFGTATEAVECAIRMQDDLTGRSRGVPENRRMLFRMGINLGEITADADDIHGDGVNIATRLEGLADRRYYDLGQCVRTGAQKNRPRFRGYGHRNAQEHCRAGAPLPGAPGWQRTAFPSGPAIARRPALPRAGWHRCPEIIRRRADRRSDNQPHLETRYPGSGGKQRRQAAAANAPMPNIISKAACAAAAKSGSPPN